MEKIDRVLRYEAAKNLRRIENMRNALLWIRQSPEGFRIRCDEFEITLRDINSLLRTSVVDPNIYSNLMDLKTRMLHGDTPPLPSEILNMYNDFLKNGEYDSIPRLVDNTFSKVRGKIMSGDWEFPVQTKYNPNQIASGLLIEGYGLLVEEYFAHPGLSRTFVLAFEEILIMRHPEFKLLADVVDWMRKETDDFSPAVAERIRQI